MPDQRHDFVYDLTCEHLRDPRGVCGQPEFGWRLASTKPSAVQMTYRIVMTSVETGETVWDSGKTRSCKTRVRYGGAPLSSGGTYVWFVTVSLSDGVEVCSSPSSFVCARTGAKPQSPWGPQRVGMVWTSNEELNALVEEHSMRLGERDDAWPWVWDAGRIPVGMADTNVVEHAWHQTLGIEFLHEDGSMLRVHQPLALEELDFAQGCLLTPCGLLVVRWRRVGDDWRYELSLAPGMRALS